MKRFAGGVFFPEEIEIFVDAFDDAWAKQVSRTPFGEDAYDLREILAMHLIMSAQRGVRNRRQLTDMRCFTSPNRRAEKGCRRLRVI
jgi:hypothetical protein